MHFDKPLSRSGFTLPGTRPGSFRLVLAFAVLLSHVSSFNVGRLAVVLFFILSGYWVSRLYATRGSTSTFGYLRDRVLRVWPLLALVALGVVLMKALLREAPPGNLWSTVALLGLAIRQDDVIGVAWSLDIELQFYVALPLAVFGFLAMPQRLRRPVLGGVLLALFSVGLLLQYHDHPTVLLYSPAFAAGAAVWFLHWKPGGLTAAASVSAFVAVCCALVLFPGGHSLLVKESGLDHDPWWHDAVFLVVALILLPFIAWNVHQRSSSVDRHLGNLSFPLYLLHFPIIAELSFHLHDGRVAKLAALLLSSVAALVIYVLVDRPIEGSRRRLRCPHEPRTLQFATELAVRD